MIRTLSPRAHTLRYFALTVASALALSAAELRAADHGDTPLLDVMGRNDAKLTDLHVFTHGANLVLALSTNPAIPKTATSYTFPTDLTLRIHIDNEAKVRFNDPEDLARYGGTIMQPERIEAEITFEITFDAAGKPSYRTYGLHASCLRQIQTFCGLRDDPFIRGPRIGRNVGSIVLELPLDAVTERKKPLLVWATAKIGGINGPLCDHAGRALRSQFPENDVMNVTQPREHYTALGVTPDVVIFDPSRPAKFPNGRLLTDDVVDLVGDARVVNNDAPFPTQNDVPFLSVFPYLAPPQPAPVAP